MPKKCNTSELLIRIDERMHHLHNEDIPEMKQDIKDIKTEQGGIKEKLNKDHFRLQTLEKDIGKSIGFKITNLIRWIVGK